LASAGLGILCRHISLERRIRKTAVVRRCKAQEESKTGDAQGGKPDSEQLEELDALHLAMMDLGDRGIYEEAAKIRDKLEEMKLVEEMKVLAALREFYEVFSTCDIDRMAKLWMPADYVYLIQPTATEIARGHTNVLQVFAEIFELNSTFNVSADEIQVSIWGGSAMVTNREVFTFQHNPDLAPCFATNHFRKVGGCWLLTHRHVSQMDEEEEDDGSLAYRLDHTEFDTPFYPSSQRKPTEPKANWRRRASTHEKEKARQETNTVWKTLRALLKIGEMGLITPEERTSLISSVNSSACPRTSVPVQAWVICFELRKTISEENWEDFAGVMRLEASKLRNDRGR